MTEAVDCGLADSRVRRESAPECARALPPSKQHTYNVERQRRASFWTMEREGADGYTQRHCRLETVAPAVSV